MQRCRPRQPLTQAPEVYPEVLLVGHINADVCFALAYLCDS